MATGRNSQTLIGVQQDVNTTADPLTKFLATSNSMDSSVEKGKSEALTGNRYTEDKYLQAVNGGGDISLELTKESLPPVLMAHGFDEIGSPAQLTTTVDGSDATTDKAKLKNIAGIEVGDTVDIGSDSGITIDSIDIKTREVTFGSSLSAAPTDGDTVTITTKYVHQFDVAQEIVKWLTVYKYLTDEGYYEPYKSCRVNNFNLSIPKKAIVTADLAVLALNAQEAVDGTPTETINALSDEASKIKAYGTYMYLNGTDYTGVVDEFNFSNNNNFDDDDRGWNDLGRRDLEAQGSEATYDFQAKFDKGKQLQLKQLMRNNTFVNLQVALKEGLIIELPKVDLGEANASVDGPDKITVNASGEALWDTTAGTVCRFKIINTQDTAYSWPAA